MSGHFSAGNQLYGEDEVVGQIILNQQQSLVLSLSCSLALALSLSHLCVRPFTNRDTVTDRDTAADTVPGVRPADTVPGYGRPTPYQGTAGRHRTMFKERMPVRNLHPGGRQN